MGLKVAIMGLDTSSRFWWLNSLGCSAPELSPYQYVVESKVNLWIIFDIRNFLKYIFQKKFEKYKEKDFKSIKNKIK